VTIRRPLLFAFTVSLVTLILTVIAYFAVIVWVLGPIPFD